MDPKQIAIGIVAVAGLVVAIAKPGTETKTLVSATETADDQEVTEIIKASPTVKTVTCEKKWHTIRVATGPELLWVCDDVGYDPGRQATLAKRAGKGGVLVTYVPTEKDDGIAVDVTVATGEPRPLPPAVELPKPPAPPEPALVEESKIDGTPIEVEP